MSRIGITGGGLALGHGGVRLAGGGVVYLLRDDFSTAASAPLTSPRTAEPGPGTLTIADTPGYQSIVGGALRMFSNGAVVSTNDTYIAAGPYTRTAGMALLGKINIVGADGRCILGWSSGLATTVDKYGIYPKSGTTRRVVGVDAFSEGQLFPAAVVGTYSAYAVILRATGAIFGVQDAGIWRLFWITNTDTTATLYARLHDVGIGALNLYADYLRALQLPAPFDTDYGLATQRLAGARSAGDTFTHEANCIIEWTQTTVPSALQTEVRFRIQDATNYWQVTVDSTGALDLDEVVAGTPTQRATAAGVIANGDRVVIIADGTTIRVYEANTLRITYASATNFATATAGELETEGTGGSVSEIIAWPRTLTGSAAAILDQVSG